MTDPRAAALAEALDRARYEFPYLDAGHEELAAAILAALPASFYGNPKERDELARQQAAEIARLRRIEEAARALMAPHTLTTTNPPKGEPTAGWEWPEWDALRAALEEKP